MCGKLRGMIQSTSNDQRSNIHTKQQCSTMEKKLDAKTHLERERERLHEKSRQHVREIRMGGQDKRDEGRGDNRFGEREALIVAFSGNEKECRLTGRGISFWKEVKEVPERGRFLLEGSRKGVLLPGQIKEKKAMLMWMTLVMWFQKGPKGIFSQPCSIFKVYEYLACQCLRMKLD